MSRIHNQNSGNLADLERRIRALETAAPMNNAAVGRSGFEVYDGGTINVSSGTLRVNGLASITGTFQVAGGSTFTGQVAISGPLTISGNTAVSGQFTVTGPTKLNGQTDIGGDTSVTGDLDVKGPLTVTGVTKLDGKTDIGGNTTVTGDLDVKGPLDVTGTLDIKGKSTLQNDLDVRNGGKVKVGGMTMDPARFNGGIVFDNGSYLAATPNGAQLIDGNAAVTVSGSQADMGVSGGGAVIAHGGGVAVTGLPSTSEKPNVYIDNYGQLRRSTAS